MRIGKYILFILLCLMFYSADSQVIRRAGRWAPAPAGGPPAFASDDFEDPGVNGDLSSNWTLANGAENDTIRCDWGDCSAGASSVSYPQVDLAAYWNADTFGDDQAVTAAGWWAQWSTVWRGPMLRWSSGTGVGTFYCLYSDGFGGTDHTTLYEVTDGSFSSLGTFATPFADTDSCYFEVDGSTITYKINGSTIGDPVEDSAVTGGQPGYYAFCNSTGFANGIRSWYATDL